MLAGVAALGWIGERALRLSSPVGAAVGAIAAHPRVLLFALAGATIAARLTGRRASQGLTTST